jgi:hypothetical protein
MHSPGFELLQGVYLGVRATESLMVPCSDLFTITNNHAPNHRIWLDGTFALSSQIQGAPHPELVVIPQVSHESLCYPTWLQTNLATGEFGYW